MSRATRSGEATAIGTPRYRQIYLVLLEAIRTGQYPPGSAIPTEAQLSERFGMSRVTVRRALQDLEVQGWIEKQHGRGTFVRRDISVTDNLPFSQLNRQISRAGQLAVKLIEDETFSPPDWVRRMLKLEGDEPVRRCVRTRSQNGLPIMHLVAWLPARIVQNISSADLGNLPLYDLLNREGYPYNRAEQTIGACLSDPVVAQELEVEVGTALLHLTRLLSYGEQPVELLELRASPNRYSIHLGWDITEENDTSSSSRVTYATQL